MVLSKKNKRLFIVGAPKCGTTALFEFLSQNPLISASKIKEPHFFSSNHFYDRRNIIERNEYESLWPEHTSEKGYLMEGSVWYYADEAAIDRIIKMYGEDNVFFIFLYRAQKEFIESLHMQLCHARYEWNRDIIKAIQLSDNSFRDYIHVSNFDFWREYWEQRKNTYICSFERFKRDNLEVLRELEALLDLPNHEYKINEVNPASRIRFRVIDAFLRTSLLRFIANSVPVRLGLIAHLHKLNSAIIGPNDRVNLPEEHLNEIRQNRVK